MAKKFGNSLDKYRAPRIVGLLTPREDIPKLFAEWREEDEKNLHLLAEFHNLAVFDYRELCIRLASETVPAFKIRPKRGRPPVWNEYLAGVLVAALEAKDNGNGIAWAAAQLAKDPLWRDRFASGNGAGDLAEVFRTKYYEFRNQPFSDVMRDSYRYHNDRTIGPLENPYYSPDRWPAMVEEALKRQD